MLPPHAPVSRMSTYREKAVRNRSRYNNRDRSAAVSHVLFSILPNTANDLLINQPLVSPASTRGKAKRIRPSIAPLVVPRQFTIVVVVTECRAPLSHTKTGGGVLVYKCRRVVGLA